MEPPSAGLGRTPAIGLLLAAGFIIALAGLALLGRDGAGTPQPDRTATGDRGPEASPATQAGSRVYKDPVTGKLGPPPKGVRTEGKRPSPRMAPRTTALPEGLEEEPSSVPGGGVQIRLKGKMRRPLRATKDDEGNLTLRHGE